MAFSDRELLARLIQCEAGGEGDAGMRGVAGVIMNRVNAPAGNICASVRAASGILFFSPVSLPVCRNLWGDGQIANIYNMRPEAIHYEIADWAIAGQRLYNVGQALWFFNPYSPNCQTYFPSNVGIFTARINEHCFYNPTDAYFQT